jgi:hypothetical protein
MKVSPLHVLHQGPVLATLARTVWSQVVARKKGAAPEPPTTPGRTFSETVPARSPALVRDYLRHVGGSASWYRGRLPFHLYPQWGFPILSCALAELPYDMIKVVNAGCGVTINGPLAADAPLRLRARLEQIDSSSERRVILHSSLVTGTDAHPDALEVEQRVIIPLSGGGKDKPQDKRRKDKPRVPPAVREVGRFTVRPGSGLDFAFLTGDFNPLHWLPPYARASGHPAPISHGFDTLARAVEVLNRNLWAGEVDRLAWIDLRFTRPLRPPADVGVYTDDEGGLFVGSLPDGPAYLTGTFGTRSSS